ncbi:hypothetical protein FXO38_20772 [Capsicum annuum]|nr:hypothetical protein FXO38_20772 [Capsicum annuum]KAF3668869.1 hypothetical protein FXO37_09300 [Capsicum annuum]
MKGDVNDDVQVQFYMVSPYVRKTMSTDQKGVYYTSLEVPDVYGVFQFKVEYEKSGVTSLSLAKQGDAKCPGSGASNLKPSAEGLTVQATAEEYQEPPEDAKLFIGNLPYDVDSQGLAQLFQ